MKRYIFPLAIFLTLSCNVFAQNHLDAYRFSQQDYEGTARFTSMGGAFGALGGDFTSLSLNPAGVGVYRSSEFTITPSVSYNKVTSDYMGISTKDSRTRFGLSNMGYVGAFLTGKEDGLVSINIGVGYNKTMNYHRKTAMQGNYINTSIIDNLMSRADKFSPAQLGSEQAYSNIKADDWDVVMAYGSKAIFPKVGDVGYDSPLYAEDRVIQERYTTQSGSNGEYVFSFGGNISNKFYFGATLGVQDISYENYIEYWEFSDRDPDLGDRYLDNLRYTEQFNISGTGYNGKFGAIYRPIPQLRLGLAIHTPTFFYLTDEYIGYMDTEIYEPTEGRHVIYDDGPKYPNLNEYRITSPLKLITSAAYTFGKVGLLSVDYEFTNYKGMRLREDLDFRGSFDSDNDEIKDIYRGTSNIRVGAEAWVNNILALRAGFIYNQSPRKDVNMDKYTYSVGIGGKFGNFFTDLGYALTTTKDYYTPYGTPNLVTEKENRSRFLLTLGFRF